MKKSDVTLFETRAWKSHFPLKSSDTILSCLAGRWPRFMQLPIYRLWILMVAVGSTCHEEFGVFLLCFDYYNLRKSLLWFFFLISLVSNNFLGQLLVPNPFGYYTEKQVSCLCVCSARLECQVHSASLSQTLILWFCSRWLWILQPFFGFFPVCSFVFLVGVPNCRTIL